ADERPRSLVARHEGRIVGHIGLCPRMFRTADDRPPVSAVHFIDWLASPAQASAGLMLLLRGCKSAAVQYAVGGSEEGQKMAAAVGYQPVATVEVYERILRPAYRSRLPLKGPGKYLRVAK